MNAAPILIRVARVLRETGLEAVMIGNAAAALQGAPVTTVDVDFLFRKTPANLRKLKKVAVALGAVIFKPYYPRADFLRLYADDEAVQLNFLTGRKGRSYDSVRQVAIRVGGEEVVVEPLRRRSPGRVPPGERTHFLRKRIGIGATCL